YKVEDDTLTLCEVTDGRGRATEFKTLSGRPSRLIVLKRHKEAGVLSDAALARLNQADTVFAARVTRKAEAALPPNGLAFGDVKFLRGKETKVRPPFAPTLPGEKDAVWLVAVGAYGPGRLGPLPTRGSHRPVRARLRAYGSSDPGFAACL